MELKNVKRYYPENMPHGEIVQYFIDEDGNDFYENLSFFKKKYKMCIEPDNGVIRSFSEDVSRLYPAGFTIVEVDKLPSGFSINNQFIFIDGIIKKIKTTQHEEEINAKIKKEHLIKNANAMIDPLQDALDLGIESEEEKKSLNAWKKYRVLLMRLDTSKAPDVEWPEEPVS
ncbi:tail fiber assembly protein [Pectobacterium brasiliense]|uniref:tail fiber assembly protein n=1 Tax=Pectobacterium brasiliense TaxID=180957 RepID=UPI002A8196AA|nr:tail fiber assembly protein [Pectobacterium brasiliense]MDY4370064.1 tail fiber assembly protein [Pectobacterium brasiliense]MDY7059596.1 tail fiber assembly protein [Pectobacterium brasiliense]